MHISEDFMKDLPSYSYRYLDMSKSLINWYQWEYTHALHLFDHSTIDYIKTKNFDTFLMIYKGFIREFEEHKKVCPCCYRGIFCHRSLYEVQMKQTLDDIKRGKIQFHRFYSGSLSRVVAQEYINLYPKKLAESYEKENYKFYDGSIIGMSVLFEIHNAVVYNLTEYNTENYRVLDDEVIIDMQSFKVKSYKYHISEFHNAKIFNYYVVLEADPKF